MQKWLLLAYKVPREPTVNRVSVWRKLKRLGAVLLNDAAWVLPATPRTTEQLEWLVTEIEELGGEATLWRAELVQAGQEKELIRRFSAQVEEPYREILAGLKRRKPDLAALSRRYRQIQEQDYFRSELGKRVFDALLAAKGATGAKGAASK